MSIASESTPYWDPYDREICADPYPAFRRLREEMPLYYNDKYDFYALSRYDDVMNGLADRDSFKSGRGVILEMIKANFPIPSGAFILEDPPLHTIHRAIVTGVFTPKKMSALEPKIREFCAHALDPLVGTGRFDFVKDLGQQMPMRVIGMLLGIPEEDLQTVRARADEKLRTEEGKPMETGGEHIIGDDFYIDYIDWRYKNPSDDLMTQLINAEFEDETGTVRKLTRDEVMIYVSILATAGNETTNRLTGWIGKTLGDHPDQRRQLAQNSALIPQAIEEVLRFEPPSEQIGRYVARDMEYYGTTVPEGSVMLFLPPAANRDERKFVNGDSFDINRERVPHLTFGHGFHVCLGAALARVEGRVALEEVLKRFPDWEVDLDNAKMSSTSTVRGWDSLPTYTNGARPKRSPKTASVAEEPEDKGAEEIPGAERWELTLSTPMGPQTMIAQIVPQGDGFTGRIDSQMGSEEINGKIDGAALSWVMNVKQPMPITLEFETEIDGDAMSGHAKLGAFGTAPLTGKRL